MIEQYFAPTTLQEAAQLLAVGGATVLAGGTDLMPQTKSNVKEFKSTLLNICRIEELKGICESNGKIHIGALTSIADILESDYLDNVSPILLNSANCFASGQVRNTATIGGNICNASPAADMIIPLLLLDATVILTSWSSLGNELSNRTVLLEKFFTGPGTTILKNHELLTSIEFPFPKKNTVGLFRKFGTRPALDISIVSVGISGLLASNTLKQARVAFGAVAPTPVRGLKTEQALEGTPLDEKRIREIARGASAEVSPISDIRASAWYRKELICQLTERMLHDVINQRT